MQGKIVLNVSEFINSQNSMMDNYTNIKDGINLIEQQAISLSKGWEGQAKELWLNELSIRIDAVKTGINETFRLMNVINDMGIELKGTQVKVNELVKSLKKNLN